MASIRPLITAKSSVSIYLENEDLYQYLLFTFMMWNDVSSMDTLLKHLKLDNIPYLSVDQLIHTDDSIANGVLANGMDKYKIRQSVYDFLDLCKSKGEPEIMVEENRLHLLELAVITRQHWNKGDVIQFLMQSHHYGTLDEYRLTLIRCLDWCFKSRSYYTIHKMVSSEDAMCLRLFLPKCLENRDVVFFLNYLYQSNRFVDPFKSHHNALARRQFNLFVRIQTVRIFEANEERHLVKLFCQDDCSRIHTHYVFVIVAIGIKICFKLRVRMLLNIPPWERYWSMIAMLSVDSNACIEQYGKYLVESTMRHQEYGMAKLFIIAGASGDISFQRKNVEVRL